MSSSDITYDENGRPLITITKDAYEGYPKSPLYGRKWQILIRDSRGGTIWDVSDSDFDDATPERGALRCTFRVEKFGYQAVNYSELVIYNLRGDTQQDVVNSTLEGCEVQISAGYVHGAYGIIYQGQVFQPLFDRLNAVDNVLTLHCIDSMQLTHGNFVATTMRAGYDARELINTMAAGCSTPMPIGNISNNLSAQRAPRGRVIFGDPNTTLRRVAEENFAQYWCDSNKLYVSRLEDPYAGDPLVLTPQTGLIGTPQQTDDGVFFRTLLNPDLRVTSPPQVVKIDQTVIQQLKLYQGQTPPTALDKSGQYKVVKIVYVGDTRGNDWYSEAVGINMLGQGSVLEGLNVS